MTPATFTTDVRQAARDAWVSKQELTPILPSKPI
jgi:hypothetical protein